MNRTEFLLQMDEILGLKPGTLKGRKTGRTPELGFDVAGQPHRFGRE